MPDLKSLMYKMFDPRMMLNSLRQHSAPKRFFQKTFFGRTQTHVTKAVEIDIQKTKRRVAGYVNPNASANVVERDGFDTFSVSTAYLKEKVPTRVDDLLTRQMGHNPYDPIHPVERASGIMGEDLRMLDERFNRREELMCAEALLTGKLSIKGKGVNSSVDFGYIPGEHTHVLSGNDGWNKDTGDPMKDLDDWRRMVNQRCGIIPTSCIVGSAVYWSIINNPKVNERLDNRRVELGTIKPADLPEGIRYLGTLQPSMLDVYAYDEWYTDPVTGEDKPIVPEDVVLLGNPSARCTMHYGLIQNLKNPVAVPRFPSVWEEEDGSARWLQLESAPLPCVVQPDAFLVAHVLS